MNPFRVEKRYRCFALTVAGLIGLSFIAGIGICILRMWGAWSNPPTDFKTTLRWGRMPNLVFCGPDVDDFVNPEFVGSSVWAYGEGFSTWENDAGEVLTGNLWRHIARNVSDDNNPMSQNCLIFNLSVVHPTFPGDEGWGNFLQIAISMKPFEASWQSLFLYLNDTESGFFSQSLMLPFSPCNQRGVMTTAFLRKRRTRWVPSPCNGFNDQENSSFSLVSVSQVSLESTGDEALGDSPDLQCTNLAIYANRPTVTEITKKGKCYVAMKIIGDAGSYLSIVAILLGVLFVKKYPRAKSVVENETLTVPWSTVEDPYPEPVDCPSQMAMESDEEFSRR